jgi:hypothetical protein
VLKIAAPAFRKRLSVDRLLQHGWIFRSGIELNDVVYGDGGCISLKALYFVSGLNFSFALN